MNQQKTNDFIDEIQKLKEEDSILALYNIHHKIIHNPLSKQTAILREIERDLMIFILKECKSSESSLETNKIIKSIQNTEIDYYFMIMYNQLKLRNLQDFANEFQYFFSVNETNDILLTLIYNLLNSQKINYDFQYKKLTINPSKLKNIESNDDLMKVEKDIQIHYEKNPSEAKIAIQVFSKYITSYWIDIIFSKNTITPKIIQNVTDYLLGKITINNLNEQEKQLLEKF
ncbi:hypothetical protein [Mycoplasma miroungirhinis]|uniref:Uncharacterized protein n=1 Tax=Mycoplasma miroungirhinis TaxID=754516 RepID=A0A6M4JE71_9MOLU|nr:hypothetical protein [Mycoplasma miroungirhinis]QJR44319.1 hypothetical protein HLA92_02670 [Mycoplasma miroungirhinis]